MSSIGIWVGIIYQIFIIALMVGFGSLMVIAGGVWRIMGAGIIIVGIVVVYFTYRSYRKVISQAQEAKAKHVETSKPWE